MSFMQDIISNVLNNAVSEIHNTIKGKNGIWLSYGKDGQIVVSQSEPNKPVARLEVGKYVLTIYNEQACEYRK